MGLVVACVIMRRYRRGCDPLVLDRTFSTYVVSWQPRSNMTEEMQARSLDVFGKWSPAAGTNFLQFLGRIDGPGGFAVVETDDPALLARDTAIFSTFFDMTVYPVSMSRTRHGSAVRHSSSFDPHDQRITLLRRRQNSVEATRAFAGRS